jgi:hypothetical protein
LIAVRHSQDSRRHDAREISRMLAGRIDALAREMLPHGKRTGPEWRAGSVAGEAGQSLAVRLSGAKAGVWSDFSSGEGGDALDLVAAVLYRGDIGSALTWSRRWLGLGVDGIAEPSRQPAPAPRDTSEDDARRTNSARAIFFAAKAELAGTPVAHYLAARSIDLAALRRQPRSLRFHPALWNSEARAELPAMVAAICGADGKMIAVHRTWLARDCGTWGKAPLATPKMVLGKFAGGSIRIWRGASGKPLADAPDGEGVIIGEGIETCLSIALMCPDRRVLASVSLSNLAQIDLPQSIRTVTIAADNDQGNDQAARALQVAIDTFAAGGRQVLIARSPVGSDFNDCLMAEAS